LLAIHLKANKEVGRSAFYGSFCRIMADEMRSDCWHAENLDRNHLAL
jgi:hypothetical protein